MPRFVKKPWVIDAIQWQGGDYHCLDQFCGLNWGRADARDVAWCGPDDKEQVVVWNTLSDQWLCVPKSYWIIRGTWGELYPCNPYVFRENYVEETR